MCAWMPVATMDAGGLPLTDGGGPSTALSSNVISVFHPLGLRYLDYPHETIEGDRVPLPRHRIFRLFSTNSLKTSYLTTLDKKMYSSYF
jgi:hypothetical protein